MSDDKNQNGLNRINRAKNFKLNIPDADWGDTPVNELYSDVQPEEQNNSHYSDTAINSYSDPRAAEKARRAQNQEEIKAEKAHQWRNKEKGRKNKRFYKFVWIIMVLFISAILSQVIISGINDMLAVNKGKVSVTVEIPKNATTAQVAEILKSAGVIRNVDFFSFYSKMTKSSGHYGSGSYKIDTNLDYEAIVSTLQSNMNRVDSVKITFKEGINVLEMAAMLDKNGVCSTKDFISTVNSNQFDDQFEMVKAITNSSDRYYKLEGYLFPDTYDFFKDEDPVQVVKKLLSNCNKKLTKQIRSSAASENMSIDQLLTLASMIQAEAADKDDMYLVSSVFHNRLDSQGKGDLLRLRSDPTTYYPYRTKAAVPSNLTGFKSRYDTYTIQGLPPGPICSPGAQAIDAALNPAKTGYYYFCHDKDGKAYYAKTNAQHERNLVKAGLK